MRLVVFIQRVGSSLPVGASADEFVDESSTKNLAVLVYSICKYPVVEKRDSESVK